MNYNGSSNGPSGSLSMTFSLYTDLGEYRYKATADLNEISKAQDGTYTYVYSGSYQLVSGPSSAENVPQHGQLGATLSWWSDGTTLYDAAFSL
jgi:hypothetical protein